MSTDKTWQTTTTSSVQTEALAARLAQNLKGGEVIELVSDLGGGKTTFVRGLAQGLDSTDKVSSPTFKISNVYHAPSLTIHHFDFYRLQDPGLIKHELAEILHDPDSIVVIEWADIIHDVVPKAHITIQFNTLGE